MSTDGLTPGLRETLALFDRTPMTTTEVATHLDLGRRSTYDRLERLTDQNLLETKKVGASARVWWRPPTEAGSDAAAGDPHLGAGTVLSSVLDGIDVGVFVLDEEFDVAWANDTVLRYFGLDRDRVVGQDKRRLIRTSVAAQCRNPGRFSDRVLATYDDNTSVETFECTVATTGADDGRRLRHHSEPIESGPFAGGRVELYEDVTERHRTETDYQTDRTELESLIDAVEEYAIFRLDADGHIQSWNSGATRIKGYEETEILGEHVSTFYTDADREADTPDRNLAAAVKQGAIQRDGWRVKKDGTKFWANVTIRAIESDGELDGFVKITRDMTEHREQERRLRRERDLTREVLETAPVGLGIYRQDGTLERVNSMTRQRIGLEMEDLSSFDIADLEFFDENGNPVSKADHPVPKVLETEEPADLVVQHDDPQGRHRWVRLAANPVFDAEGDLHRVVIAAEDFTDLKRKERQLERQRDDLSEELDEMFERIDEAFFALDDCWQITYVNDAGERLLDRSAGELVGQSVWDAVSESVDSTFETELRRARREQESVTFEQYVPSAAAWFEMRVYPSKSGLSVYFKDVSERRRRTEELERYETIVETMSDGVYVIDDTGTITMANGSYAEMLGYEQSDVVGMEATDIVSSEVSERARDIHRQLATGERQTARLEAELKRIDGDTLVAEATFAITELRPGSTERIGVVRDVTDRRERERRLERYEAIVETVEDGIYAVDEDARFRMVNDGFCRLTGYDRAELLGAHATIVHDDEITNRAESLVSDVVSGDREVAVLELDIETQAGERVPCESRVTPLSAGGDTGRCGVVRDISTHLEQEQELETRLAQQQVVADLGQRALETEDIDALMDEASRAVSETLGTDYCKVLDLDDEETSLLLRQGTGWKDGVVGNASVSAVEKDSQASYTLSIDETVVVEDLTTETRFSGPDLLTSHDVRSGISTIIGSVDRPWGILGTHDTDRQTFSETDVNFVQSVANVLASAIKRREDEAQLRRQRELLAASNSLNTVVRETTKAVIEQPTREQIESVVCENLVQSDSYEMAWIGEVDNGTDTVSVRTAAGDDGNLDGVDVTVDPDDEADHDPTATALRTGELAVARDLAGGQSHERVRDRVDGAAVESVAAIPIVHNETVYGVITVYSARPNAFERAENLVIGPLGEVIGHAIAATERKRALLSEEVVELEFAIRDVFDEYDVEGLADGTLQFDRAIPVNDELVLVYGSASPAIADALPTLVDAIPHWQSITCHPNGEETTFELRVSEPPIISAIADAGGLIAAATIEDGTYKMTVHLAPSTDSRPVIDAIQGANPNAELLRRRQRQRNERTPATIQNVLVEELTDRQRTTLETAYHAGFFEWPRNASGEDVAESLNIASPTFHQHLRKAERKVLDAVLSESVVEG